jgi:hypothetical protein
MPRTFYALCRVGGTDTVRRIPVQAQVQAELEGLFDVQEQEFLAGRDEEIDFTGDWKPDSNQLLTIDDPGLSGLMTGTLGANPTIYPALDISSYQNAGVKAVFTESATTAGRILIQRFRTSQFLQKTGITLIFSNNVFNKLSEHGFSLDSRLTAILDGTVLKFHSFVSLRTIFTVQEHFTEATAQEVDTFAAHVSFHIENRAIFDSFMDERCRKLIKGICKSGILDEHDVVSIRAKATLVGIVIADNAGRLVLPNTKKELKAVLSFLEESVYKGVFSEDTFLTNSKRRLD